MLGQDNLRVLKTADLKKYMSGKYHFWKKKGDFVIISFCAVKLHLRILEF